MIFLTLDSKENFPHRFPYVVVYFFKSTNSSGCAASAAIHNKTIAPLTALTTTGTPHPQEVDCVSPPDPPPPAGLYLSMRTVPQVEALMQALPNGVLLENDQEDLFILGHPPASPPSHHLPPPLPPSSSPLTPQIRQQFQTVAKINAHKNTDLVRGVLQRPSTQRRIQSRGMGRLGVHPSGPRAGAPQNDKKNLNRDSPTKATNHCH